MIGLYAVGAAVGAGALLFAGTASASPVDGTNAPGSPAGASGGNGSPVPSNDPDANVDALLSALLLAESAGDFGALVGGGSTSDLSHHPAFTDASNTTRSAWRGWRNSHAAGGWQFQPQTWIECAASIGAQDFEPANQKAGAIYLLQRRGALADVRAGDLPAALYKLRNEWQSIPVRGNAWFTAQYADNGGFLA